MRATTKWRLVAAVVVWALGSTVAAAQDEAGVSPEVAEFVSDGHALEELLDSVGLGAAWRSATSVGPRARGMRVELDEVATETLGALISRVEDLARAEVDRSDNTERILAAAIAIERAIETEQNAIVARNIARHELGVINAILRIVAVDLFEVAYDGTDQLLALDPAVLNQAHRTREVTQLTVEEMIARKLAAEDELERREQALVDAIDARAQREADHADLVEHQTTLAVRRGDLDVEARELLTEGAEQWVLSEIAGAGYLTPRALDAYLGAEQAMTLDQPRCRISWATIAAVSAVEGRHGTHGGAHLGFDGTSNPRIIGIALDGEAEDNYGNQVANIADTDRGVYDGDRVLDRAVGPMQFIPQTWESWRVDGDGDGVADPHDLDDAAVGAASYLCAYGSHRSWVNWNRAIHAYNHSNAYVASVKANLDRINRLVLPDVDDGLEWQPRRPAGAYVEPPPEPEPEGEEGEGGEGGEPAADP